MKKYFVIAIAALATFAACTKNNTNIETPKQEVSFKVAKYLNTTKASGAVYPTTETFGTYSWFNGTDAFMEGEEVGYSSNVWKTLDRTYYWPKTGSITFVSWSPFSVTPQSVAVNEIKFKDYVAGSTDLMLADRATCSSNINDVTNDAIPESGFTGVPTFFRHLLAKVSFKIKANFVEYGTAPDKTSWEIKVTSLKIGGIYTKGDVDLTWGTKWTAASGDVWANPSTPTSAQELVSSPITLTTSAEDLSALTSTYVLPQTLADDTQKIVISYTIKTTLPNGNEIEETITDKEIDIKAISSLTAWKMNQNIVYTITVKPTATSAIDPHYDDPEDVVITFDPAIADWETVNTGATIHI